MAENHDQEFRPLRAGISIFNPSLDDVGTIGFFGHDDDGATWLVSCAHILLGSSEGGGDGIQQPPHGGLVARTLHPRVNTELDVAAVRLEPDLLALSEILGIGAIGPTAEARVGMRVLKAGFATGVTEGVVTEARDARVVVRPPPEFPRSYELTAKGDSGSLWVTAEDHRAVAIHTVGNNGGREYSRAVPVGRVLEVLSLRLP